MIKSNKATFEKVISEAHAIELTEYAENQNNGINAFKSHDHVTKNNGARGRINSQNDNRIQHGNCNRCGHNDEHSGKCPALSSQ